jgi:carbohydrate-selective porin OprB
MKWFHSKGVEVHASLKAEASSNFHSGFSGDGTDYRGLVETTMGIDMQKAIGWSGAQVQASFHDYFGSNATERLMGDTQGFSNIDTYPMNRIYELWFQQSLAHSKLRIKLGRIDANTEFAYVENATEFLNSSMGFSPTILDMHTYPNPRLGAVVAFAPGKFLSVSAAIFRCMPSGSMVLGEAGTRWKISSRASAGRLAVGFWIHPHTLDGFHGTQTFGVHGFYAVLEQTLWKRASEIDDDSRGIRAFAQWGDSNPWFNGITRHVGTGFEWTGAFSQRPADVVGLGFTRVRLGEDSDRDVSTGRERSIETFYKVPVRSWLSFTPDFQWIVNPSGSLERPRALAGTMRMVISF